MIPAPSNVERARFQPKTLAAPCESCGNPMRFQRESCRDAANNALVQNVFPSTCKDKVGKRQNAGYARLLR